MKILKLFALLSVLMPTQLLANTLLSEGEMKFLIQTCFASFYHPGRQPYQVDREKFAAMRFSIIEDNAGTFEAQRILEETVLGLTKERFGPSVKIRRKKNDPDKLLHKSCKISGDRTGIAGNNVPHFTDLTSKKVQEMLEAEATRLGFKPYRNRKSKVVWIKGDVAVFLDVAFTIKLTESAVAGSQPPLRIFVDGVHPKDMRGISQ